MTIFDPFVSDLATIFGITHTQPKGISSQCYTLADFQKDTIKTCRLGKTPDHNLIRAFEVLIEDEIRIFLGFHAKKQKRWANCLATILKDVFIHHFIRRHLVNNEKKTLPPHREKTTIQTSD